MKYKEYEQVSNNEEKEMPPPPNGVNRPNRGRWCPFLFMSILTLMDPVTSCSSVPVVISNVPTCTVVNSVQTCQYLLDFEITLESHFDETCINLIDINGNPVDTLIFRYLNFIYHPQLRFNYLTSAFTCISEADKTCYTPSNWCGNRCNNMAADDNTGQGQLSDPMVTTCPGVTKCTRTCGCTGCDCFYCDASCTVFRWALQSVGPLYTVYEITGLTAVPTIFMYSQNNDSINSFISPFPGVTVSNYYVNMTQRGAFQTPTDINLAGYGVIIDDNSNMYWNPVSPLGTPEKLKVGDIQYSTRSQVTCGLTTDSLNTVFDPNIGISGETSVTCLISGTSNLTKLPLTFGGYTIQKDFFSLAPLSYLTPPVFPPITISVQTNNYTISQTVDYVCPVLTFINVSGCYQCPFGYLVLFTLKSKCIAGPVLISASNCIAKTFFADTTVSTYNISCQSNDTTVIDSLVASSNTPDVNVPITGTLNPPVTTGKVFGQTSTNNILGSDIGFDASFLTSGLLGIFTPGLGSTFSFIFNLLIIAFLICIGAFVMKTLLTYKSTKLKSEKADVSKIEPKVVEKDITSTTRRRKSTVRDSTHDFTV